MVPGTSDFSEKMTRKRRCFSWPSREDIQTVDTEFVLKTGFIPDCMSSGRMWHISESELIDKLFTKFRAVFFKENLKECSQGA